MKGEAAPALLCVYATPRRAGWPSSLPAGRELGCYEQRQGFRCRRERIPLGALTPGAEGSEIGGVTIESVPRQLPKFEAGAFLLQPVHFDRGKGEGCLVTTDT